MLNRTDVEIIGAIADMLCEAVEPPTPVVASMLHRLMDHARTETTIAQMLAETREAVA